MVVRAHDHMVRVRVTQVTLGVQDDWHQEAVLILRVDVELVLCHVLNVQAALVVVILDEHDLSHGLVVDAVQITLAPGIDITLTPRTVLQILQEHFHERHGASAVQRQLASRLQKLRLVLLDERSVKDTTLENGML